MTCSTLHALTFKAEETTIKWAGGFYTVQQQTSFTTGSQTDTSVAPPIAYLNTTPGNHCGHQHKASIRYFHDNDWISLCLDCWRRQRSEGSPHVQWPSLTRFGLNSGTAFLANALGLHANPRQHDAFRNNLYRRAVPTQRPHRIMLYSHDTYGLGHLRRNLAIARQLLAFPGRFEVLLITGSPMQDSWPLPSGLTVRALPPVIKLGDEHYGPRDHAKNFALLKGHREALILEAALSFRPDVLLVDHAPIGMGGELLPTLALLQEEHPQTRLVLGMRDIIDAPHATKKVWQEQGIIDILDRVYDAILVYGREDWFDVVATYDMPPTVADKVRYCGYVCNEYTEEFICRMLPEPPSGYPRILVTVGGGGDGSRIIEAYLTALRRLHGFGCQSLIVPGPLMDPAERERLELTLDDMPTVHLIDGATDMLPLMRQCDLVISMAGYNTSAEILSLGCKAILVPRAYPRAEQRLRAEMLARFGLAEYVDPDGDLVEQLARLVPLALSDQSCARSRIMLDGTARVAAELNDLAARPEAELTA